MRDCANHVTFCRPDRLPCCRLLQTYRELARAVPCLDPDRGCTSTPLPNLVRPPMQHPCSCQTSSFWYFIYCKISKLRAARGRSARSSFLVATVALARRDDLLRLPAAILCQRVPHVGHIVEPASFSRWIKLCLFRYRSVHACQLFCQP